MKTDIEISRALALAIGWPAEDITDNFDPPQVFTPLVGWRVFDYRDWNVISPIAARYKCFPEYPEFHPGWFSWCDGKSPISSGHQDTPQKAIALAVIGARP